MIELGELRSSGKYLLALCVESIKWWPWLAGDGWNNCISLHSLSHFVFYYSVFCKRFERLYATVNTSEYPQRKQKTKYKNIILFTLIYKSVWSILFLIDFILCVFDERWPSIDWWTFSDNCFHFKRQLFVTIAEHSSEKREQMIHSFLNQYCY